MSLGVENGPILTFVYKLLRFFSLFFFWMYICVNPSSQVRKKFSGFGVN